MVDHRSVNPQQSTQWRKKFAAAMREPNKNKLAILITEAEDAIFARLHQLDGKADPERDAIAAAIPELRKLQVEKLNFPRSMAKSSRRRGNQPFRNLQKNLDWLALGNDLRNTCLTRILHRDHLSIGCKENQRDFWHSPLQYPRGRYAVHLRHGQIEHYQMWLQTFGFLDAFAAVGCFPTDLPAGKLERPPQPSADDCAVVD